MFIFGFLSIVGSIMNGMITGGGIGPFLHGGAALFVFAASFFAGLAMSKGKFNEKVNSKTGDAAVLIGWIGFIVGITLIAGNLEGLLANKTIGSAFSIAILTVLYGYCFKLVCYMYINSKIKILKTINICI